MAAAFSNRERAGETSDGAAEAVCSEEQKSSKADIPEARRRARRRGHHHQGDGECDATADGKPRRHDHRRRHRHRHERTRPTHDDPAQATTTTKKDGDASTDAANSGTKGVGGGEQCREGGSMGHETEATSVAPPQSWDDGTPPPRRQPRPGYLPYVLRPPALELLSIPQQPPEGRCCPPISPTESSNVHAVLPRAPAYPYACWRAGEDASSGELCSSRVATPPAQASSETQCRERASGRVCGRPFAPAEQGAPTRDGRPVAALEMTPRVPRRFARPAATIAMPPPPTATA